MYKNPSGKYTFWSSATCFNPCFNGSMYKNPIFLLTKLIIIQVSILVLMDLCIKTARAGLQPISEAVSILVLMDLCIKTMAEIVSAMLK